MTDKASKTPLPAAELAKRIFERARMAGLVIRAFPRGVRGYAPPLCCKVEEIVERTLAVLDATLADSDLRAAMA